jgi:hypothetical protein
MEFFTELSDRSAEQLSGGFDIYTAAGSQPVTTIPDNKGTNNANLVLDGINNSPEGPQSRSYLYRLFTGNGYDPEA